MKKYLKPIRLFADVFAVALALGVPLLVRIIRQNFGDSLPVLCAGFIAITLIWALLWMYTALTRSGNMRLFGTVYWYMQIVVMVSALIPGIGALPGEEADIVSFLSVVLNEYYIEPLRAPFINLSGFSSLLSSVFIAVFLILFALVPLEEKTGKENKSKQENHEIDEKPNVNSIENEKT
ncbi:MAG: hypothetical protein GX897_06285 [Clostridiales bacterium]|nr:hypothetical protein [Clostridiales bacterium]